MRTIINPKYGHLESFVRQVTDTRWFARNGEVLHSGRNTVKLFDIDGLRLVVKSYGHPSFINRLVYGVLRKSKAVRAFLHAGRLRDLGIDTPEEVAAVEIRKKGLLQSSYFISLYTDYLPLRPVTESYMRIQESTQVLDALSRFLFKLHWAGVMHNDLNIGNILYKNDGRGYRFQLIDTNRMEFCRTLSMRQRLENLRRLSCALPAYLYILQRYAESIQANPNFVQFKGVLIRLCFESRQRFKRKLSALI